MEAATKQPPPVYWREAATLIVTGRSPASPSGRTLEDFDYKTLLLQRSAAARFMPGRHVFPGGAVDPEDFSEEWGELYERVTGIGLAEIDEYLKITSPIGIPPIMLTDRGTSVPSAVGLRLCAIRECFEESGLLLARGSTATTSSANFTSIAEGIPPGTLNQYQKEVRKDARKFREMCDRFGVVPDVWGLKEWGNWLTPHFNVVTKPPKRPHRFDTIFYICALDRTPAAEKDNAEIVACRWIRPDLMLTEKSLSQTVLGPQLYQLSQMINFRSQRELVDFFTNRARLGIERWLVVIKMCQDGRVSILPGDDQYPEQPDYEGFRPIDVHQDQTIKDLFRENKNNHHMIYYNDKTVEICCNIEMAAGHCRPLIIDKTIEFAKL